MIYSGLTSDQLSGMGIALTQGGSGLLHIAIQIMPYAIVMTIILIIFGIVKNWSKLSNKWESGYYKKGSLNNIFGEKDIWIPIPMPDESPRDMMSTAKKKELARRQLHEMNEILRDPENDYFYMTYNHLAGDYYLKNGVVYYKYDGEKDEENNGYSHFETDEDFDFINDEYTEFMRYYDDWKSTGKSHDR